MVLEEDNAFIKIEKLFKIFQKERFIILIITLAMGIIGWLYCTTLNDEYISNGKLLPEIQSKNGSVDQFAGLAAFAGIDISNISGGSDAVRPDLYPNVLESTPFYLQLFKEKVTSKSRKNILFKDYYLEAILDEKQRKDNLMGDYSNIENFVSFNSQTEKIINDLKKRITCTYDKKGGIITITVKMPDPLVAANVASISIDYLREYIIEYRTEKQQRDLDFLEERLKIAKGKYYNIQSKKASYLDRMPLTYLRIQSIDLQRERLEVDYKSSSAFYNTLLQKYEEGKLRLQQETPIIKILDPPTVANKKSEPKVIIIIIEFMLIGFLMSLIISTLRKNNYRVLLK